MGLGMYDEDYIISTVKIINESWRKDTFYINRTNFLKRFSLTFGIFYIATVLISLVYVAVLIRHHHSILGMLALVCGLVALCYTAGHLMELYHLFYADIYSMTRDMEFLRTFSKITGRLYSVWIAIDKFEFIDESKQIKCRMKGGDYVYFTLLDIRYNLLKSLSGSICCFNVADVVGLSGVSLQAHGSESEHKMYEDMLPYRDKPDPKSYDLLTLDMCNKVDFITFVFS